VLLVGRFVRTNSQAKVSPNTIPVSVMPTAMMSEFENRSNTSKKPSR
jgi:hypothetical protein